MESAEDLYGENQQVEEEVDELDAFETGLQKQQSNIWANGGQPKEYVIAKIIKYFGSMVVRVESDIDGAFIYDKAPNASLNILRTRVLLRNSENYETRDFTIFISKRKWVKTELRPLMELCSDNQLDVEADRDLAMRCCKLAMILVKRMKDSTLQHLNVGKFRKAKRNSSNLNDDLQLPSRSNKANALEQISALLSFKESLCTEKCLKAVTLIFADALQKESVISRENSKEDLATCLSYLRRMLAIEAIPSVSSPTEVLTSVGVHHRLIYHSRAMLSTIPSICADILNRYHDDWLSDIILIIFFCMRGFKASDFFQVWKENRLLSMEDFQQLDVHASHTDTNQSYTNTNVKKTIKDSKATKSTSTTNTKKADITTIKKEKGLLSQLLEKEATWDQFYSRSGGRLGSSNRRFVGTFQTSCPVVATTSRDINKYKRNGVQAVVGDQQDATLDALLGSSQNDVNSPVDKTKTAAIPTSTEKQPRNIEEEGITTDESKKQSAGPQMPYKRMLHTPFMSTALVEQQTGHWKRTKKNLVFTKEDPYVEIASASKSDEDGKRACVVIATMIDFICESAGLAQLVRRVNEDLRRGEGRVSLELELVYFHVLATLQQYHRLKLQHQKQIEEQTYYKQQQQQREQQKRQDSKNSLLEDIIQEQSNPHITTNTTTTTVASTTTTTTHSSKDKISMKRYEWIPNLENIIHSLDKMSFSRTAASLQTLILQGRHYDIVKPMVTFKEMICYLRLLLESANMDHNEIAVAALYRIFYNRAPGDRLDPILKLIQDWKHGYYPKIHLESLVELIHETFKTLETAYDKFNSNSYRLQEKKLKKKKLKNDELDIEQYISSCLQFNVNEYFRRITSYHTITLYTALLSKYNQNSPTVNHYIFTFFKRLCEYKFEQPYPTPMPAAVHLDTKYHISSKNPLDKIMDTEEPSLGYMLFNLQTMMVFNTLLNDSLIQLFQPLLALIKAVVRKFFQLSEKNHMMFVEILFHPAAGGDICIQYDNVYEAIAYKFTTTTTTTDTDNRKKTVDMYDDYDDKYHVNHTTTITTTGATDVTTNNVGNTENQSISMKTTTAITSNTITHDYGEEMDENDDIWYQSSTTTTTTMNKKAKLSKLTKRNMTRPSIDSDNEEDNNDKDEDIEDDGDSDNPKTVTQKRKVNRHQWTTEEDDLLRQKYPIYEGTTSVYDILVTELSMIENGKEVSVDQVKTRLRTLKLLPDSHIKATNTSKGRRKLSVYKTDSTRPTVSTENKKKSKKRLRRKAYDSDESSDDEEEEDIHGDSDKSDVDDFDVGGDKDINVNKLKDDIFDSDSDNDKDNDDVFSNNKISHKYSNSDDTDTDDDDEEVLHKYSQLLEEDDSDVDLLLKNHQMKRKEKKVSKTMKQMNTSVVQVKKKPLQKLSKSSKKVSAHSVNNDDSSDEDEFITTEYKSEKKKDKEKNNINTTTDDNNNNDKDVDDEERDRYEALHALLNNSINSDSSIKKKSLSAKKQSVSSTILSPVHKISKSNNISSNKLTTYGKKGTSSTLSDGNTVLSTTTTTANQLKLKDIDHDDEEEDEDDMMNTWDDTTYSPLRTHMNRIPRMNISKEIHSDTARKQDAQNEMISDSYASTIAQVQYNDTSESIDVHKDETNVFNSIDTNTYTNTGIQNYSTLNERLSQAEWNLDNNGDEDLEQNENDKSNENKRNKVIKKGSLKKRKMNKVSTLDTQYDASDSSSSSDDEFHLSPSKKTITTDSVDKSDDNYTKKISGLAVLQSKALHHHMLLDSDEE